MQSTESQTARIMIVDDEESTVRLLEVMLRREGYQAVSCVSDPRCLLSEYDAFKPDLVLLDLWMPHRDGFEAIQDLRSRLDAEDYLPIVVLTADTSLAARERALSMGAHDFLSKPFELAEIAPRLRNLLETRFLYRRLRSHNRQLDERVRQRTQELEEAQIEILERLARAAEYRDDDTGEHTKRVGDLSARIARAMGMAEPLVERLRMAARLHDLGKTGVPDGILLKPGRLSLEEIEIMKS
ncbi:MAG TPA: response regulator, partial [Chthonomonadales bacterium]|nr:response regulator [Chthonomonadales bacterium]